MRNLIISTVLLLTIGNAVAQQVPFSSMYYSNPFAMNPAFTGDHENTNVFLTHRSQWTGIAGAPQTSNLTIDGPIAAKNVGLGLNLYSDATGITNNTGAFANYSYKLKINDDNNISFGLAMGVINTKIDFAKAVYRDANDPYLFSQSQNKTVFSADFGLGYNWKKLQVGFVIPQLLGNSAKFKTDDGSSSYYTLARHYQGSIKYVFDLVKEKEITVYPLIMVRYATGSVIQYDVNAVLDWKKIGWFGITYHSNDAVAVSGGVRYKNLSVGYAYDIGVSKVKTYMGSTSEFLLSYTFGGAKKDDGVAKTEDPKDTLVDNMMARLKVKSDSSAAEIQRLKGQMAKLQAGGGTSSTAPANTGANNTLTENLMREGESTDFVDDNGMGISSGFYVIIGTFSSKENANKFKDANVIKGYRNTQVSQNHKTKAYYVYVNKFDKQADAEAEQGKFKTEYPDVWIEKLK